MQDARYGIRDKKNHASFLLVLVSCLFLISCMTKKIELPDYEGVDIKEVISEHNSIKSVEATFSVEFEKGESVMTGDAALELTDNTLNLRIYSLGFLVAEITETDGVIKCNPELSVNRSLILVDGLRNSIFWWRIQSFEIDEQGENYQLRNSRQNITIAKKTMLPAYQTIELAEGKQLRIFYDNPVRSGDFRYPSKMRIELARYAVKMQIKTISVLRRQVQGPRQPH